MNRIPEHRLREFLAFDSEKGIFTRLIATGPRGCHKIGTVAGTLSHGRVQIRVGGYSLLAHRLAWWFVYGIWPPDEIDHINCDPADNRIVNLRLANRGQNQQNRHKPLRNNKAGVLGVYWHKQMNCWTAQIQINGRGKSLGLFKTTEEASAAYRSEKARLHPFALVLESAA